MGYLNVRQEQERTVVFRSLVKLTLAFISALSLTACVESQAPLIDDARPLLGQQFGVHLYEEFVDNKAGDVHSSVYWWKDGEYVRAYGLARDARRFVAQPLEGNDFLLQSSDEGRGVYLYWVARKLSPGVYLLFAVDETAVDEPDRGVLCGTAVTDGICRIQTRDQLIALARATAARPPKATALAVVVGKPPAF